MIPKQSFTLRTVSIGKPDAQNADNFRYDDVALRGSDIFKQAFQFLRHRKDVTELARLVFGTLSTSVKKGSLKIHT